MARLPTRTKWRGIFPGEKRGDIISAYNIDLQRNVGSVHIAEKLQEIFNSTDDAQLGNPTGFIKSDADNTNRFWVLAGAVLFKSDADDPENGWAQDAISGTPTDARDRMVEFAGDMYVPTTTDMDRLSGGTWTNPFWSAQGGASALTSGVYHGLWISPVADLLIPDGRFVNSWDGSSATDPKLTLPSQFEITGGITEGDFAVIITKTTDSTEARVFHWNGTDSVVSAEYPVGTRNIVSVASYRGVPYIVTLEGQIRAWNGSGYEPVQELPTYALSETVSNVFMGPLEGKLGISCNASGSTSVFGQTAKGFDGLWLFDPETLDLYPRYSLNSKSTSVSSETGHMHIVSAGAFLETVAGSGRLITGGKIYTVYTTTQIFVLNTSMESNTSGAKGRFVTKRFDTSNVRDLFKRITPIFKKLEDSTHRIVVKYKIQSDILLPTTRAITWVNATSFTVTADGLSVGNEVEFLAGPNAGSSAHILSIVGSTITIDTTLSSSSVGGLARFDNWVLISTVSSQAIQKAIINIRKKSSFILFKFELKGTETSPEFRALQIDRVAKRF